LRLKGDPTEPAETLVGFLLTAVTLSPSVPLRGQGVRRILETMNGRLKLVCDTASFVKGVRSC
jgi:hypothetical protein